MNITEVQAARNELAQQIQSLVGAFETATGTQVHSIPVIRNNPALPPTVEVKVQIP